MAETPPDLEKGVQPTPAQVTKLLLEGVVRRYVQDSPILLDVWVSFAQHPTDAIDLLLTPHSDARAGMLAMELREALRHQRADDPSSVSVAPLPRLVAARVTKEELFTVILPRTTWWSALVRAHPDLMPKNDGDRERLRLAVSRLRALGPDDAMRAEAEHEARTNPRLPAEWVWLVSVVGALMAPAGSEAWPPSADKSVAAFVVLYASAPDAFAGTRGKQTKGKQERGPRKDDQTFWRVALNRDANPTTDKSVLAIKADAARRLFAITCDKIVWAILDTGIDQTHPAFKDRASTNPKATRIVRTYDFTKVRDCLDPAFLARTTEGDEIFQRLKAYLKFRGQPSSVKDVMILVRETEARLERGMEVDWATLEPFLELVAPPPPQIEHGTHVAGILAADWREKDGRILVQGVCPEIRLIDMRVISDRPGAEFGVIAALQFIQFLNDQGEGQPVHGANLSFVTPHDAKHYACGSTPVCEACNTLVGSGVVVVAAAGNNGHRTEMLADGRELSTYFAITITDPGNAEDVITVGSAHRERPHQYGVSYFSSRGPTGDGRAKPDLVAPGEKINSVLPGQSQGARDGTSQAAPHVSGVAAQLMARHPELVRNPKEIKRILCATASDLGRDRYFQGAGLVNALRALQSL